MALTIVTAPVTDPVTLAEAKEHLRIDEANTAESALITAFITASTDYCEKLQNRAFITQVWDMTLDSFPRGDIISIPLPPLQAVSSVTYLGTGGTSNTLTASTYIVDTANEPGRISLAFNEVWPTIDLQPVNGVVVKFTAGYGTAGTVPEMPKQAIKLLVGHMFENRENTNFKPLELIPDGVFNLLAFERIWPV